MDAHTLAKTVTQTLRGQSCVRALFLSGSHGAGLEDAYSDIDFLAAVPANLQGDFVESWRTALGPAGEIVLWRELRGQESLLINAITESWMRIDVHGLAPARIAGRAKDGLKMLFDDDGIAATLVEGSATTRTDARRLLWQFEEFLRILGLLPLAVGRKEYLNAVTGLFHLRNLLIDLLIEETGAPHRGGALHLNRLITDEQKALLVGLPTAVSNEASTIAAHLAYAAAYLPRARKLAAARGIDWPARFEAATRAHLKTTLAIEMPTTGA